MSYYDRERNMAEGLRQMYPQGTRVECLSMMDPFSPVPSGTRGTVFHVDDMATIHVHWDNGSSLGLVRGEDSFRKLSAEEVEAENASEQDDSPDEESGFKMKM